MELQQRLHPNTRHVTENIGILYVFNFVIIKLLYILLPKFTIPYQVIYLRWSCNFYIEYNIVATKSLIAATIDIFDPQCHLNLRESCVT